MSVAPATDRESLRDSDDDVVAGGVAQGVVDRLEPVDVDEDAVHRVAWTACLFHHLRADHGQAPAVGDAGQVVTHGGGLGRCASAREVPDARPPEMVDGEGRARSR